MLNARFKFAADGALLSSSYPNIVQGDKDTTKITVVFLNQNGEEQQLKGYVIDCVVERPDGSLSPSLLLSKSGSASTEASLIIGSWISEIAGNVQFTFRLKKEQATGGYEIKATGICPIVIKKGLAPADPTIKEADLDALEKAIVRNQDNIITNTQDIANLQADVTNKVDKTKEPFQVYGTNYLGEQTTIPYSVEVQENKPTIPLRDRDGRLKVECPLENQHAANKQYVDEATTMNKIGIIDVSDYDENTGVITWIYDSSVLRNIDDSRLEEDGIIRLTANPTNWDCKPKGGI